MFRNDLSDVHLCGHRAAGPRPSFRPAVEVLEERVALSSPATLSTRQFNGTYLTTIFGQVSTANGPATIQGFNITVNLQGFTLQGVISVNVTLPGFSFQIQGQAALVRGIPTISGIWMVSLGGGMVGGIGTWNAVQLTRQFLPASGFISVLR
jgi:hypothetical protein